jgi:radical SAM superfamily enzyme YgiQ (UPF0313 family)
MKLRIIVCYVPRYRRGHFLDFVPPVTGIHLAALAPPEWEVEVVHEQVRPVPIEDDVDLVALSFFSGFADRAYDIADAYRALGVQVVVGGPHATYWVDEALEHADAVVTGEAESVFGELLGDASRGRMQRVYRGMARPLTGLPTPRYDLLESRFVVRRVIQATRGCPFSCSFCSVPDLNPGFRTRPVDDVIRDIESSRFALPWQDRVCWFWDDNLLVQRRWAKELLGRLAGLDRWWLTQASIDIVKDDELMRLMERSGCIGIFLGIESFDRQTLHEAGKRQNHVERYRDAVERLHDRGISVMAGFIAGFDNQTAADVVEMADHIDSLGFDVPFLSVLTPFRGTPLYDQMLREGRIRREVGWNHYNGYNVAFHPARMRADELRLAHRRLWQRAFAPSAVASRLARAARQLRAGAAMLSAAMNGFYGFKRVTGNLPADATRGGRFVAHPDVVDGPGVRCRRHPSVRRTEAVDCASCESRARRTTRG